MAERSIVTMTLQGNHSYEQFCEAILEVALPILPPDRQGESVLLAVDDDVMALAGAHVGYNGDDPARVFGQLVEARYRIAATGATDGTRPDGIAFARRARPDLGLPSLFGACAALVLAASRMTTDQTTGANNYYDRLWSVLGRRPERPAPFDFDYVPHLFDCLAEWMAEDLAGSRGVLLRPSGGPSNIGPPINQCVFRERDKEHLAEFFADRVGRRDVHLDLLALLEVSGHRHRLTRRAQEALADPLSRPLVSAALNSAYRSWDGSRRDHRGRRAWLARLHLAVNRGVRLSVSAPGAPSGLQLDDIVLADPDRGRLAFAWSQLDALRTAPARWGGRRGIYLPACGDTLIFEVRDDGGLTWVPAPGGTHAFVLTCDPGRQRDLAEWTFEHRDLPDGWALFARVPADRLAAGAQAETEGRPAVTLDGGLPLGSDTYLTGGWLHVHLGAVDRPLVLTIDGRPVGTLEPQTSRALPLRAGQHRITVGDDVASFTVHLLDRNSERRPYGTVRMALDRSAEAASACGATIEPSPSPPHPVLLRHNRVLVLDAAGVAREVSRPSPPAWLANVGLDPQAARWELQAQPADLWVLTDHGALAVRPELPDDLGPAARVALRRLASGRPRVRSLHRGDREAAVDAFAVLVELAVEEPSAA